MSRIYKSFSTTSPEATKNGNLYDMDVVVEDIRAIMKTKKGDYPMDNDRGLIAYNYIYEPELNQSDILIIKEDIEQQLLKDPRVQDVSVFVEKDDNGFLAMVNVKVAGLDSDINLEINLEE